MFKTRICPVCGNIMKDAPCEICEICNWESDWYQEEFPDIAGGPNHISLNHAKEEYKKRHASK